MMPARLAPAHFETPYEQLAPDRLHGLLTAEKVDSLQRDLDAVAAELERALE
jgi:hypothetical protein